MATITVSNSTGVYSSAFLMKMWESRTSLTDYEKRGLYQILYIFFSSRIEGLLAELLQSRLSSLGSLACRTRNLKEKAYTNNRRVVHSLASVSRSLELLSQSGQLDLRSASLERLRTMFDRLFHPNLDTRLGGVLSEDLKAMSFLRNLFAHGRDLYFTSDDDRGFSVQIEKSQLRVVFGVLHKAGLCQLKNVDMKSFHDAWDQIYSDAVLLHFRQSALKIQRTIITSPDLPPDDFGLERFLVPDLTSHQ